jgi:cytochrome c-type biogenesis protein CcmE
MTMRSRKRQRLWIACIGLLLLGAATALALNAFEDNLVFFHGPSDITAGKVEQGRLIRIGGLVQENSVKKIANTAKIEFRITDGVAATPVVFEGILPDLFREGQGVVANGRLDANGLFTASEILAKHDENYMPPEVVEALKKSGQWKIGEGAAPNAAGGNS